MKTFINKKNACIFVAIMIIGAMVGATAFFINHTISSRSINTGNVKIIVETETANEYPFE